MRFTVITYISHSNQNDRYYSYAPYIREMNLWFKHVEEVEVVAPSSRSPGPQKRSLIGEPYEHSNLYFTEIPAFNLLSVFAVLKSIFKIPVIFFKILRAMYRSDHIHLRCPGNISLLGCIAQIFFPKKPKTVKYAGNWDLGAKQPWTYRLQKWILSNTFLSRNIKVLVYGEWPRQSKNIVPFFTASFAQNEEEINRKNFNSPYKFIYTGNLVEGKGIFESIELVEAFNKKGVMSQLEIYGDGILKNHLEKFIQKESLQNLVKFKGRRSLEELKEAYKKAHFVILLSKSEGWPKTLAEGMWYGCVPIATSVSCVPWMLGEGSRGVLIPGLEKREENRKKRSVLLNDESLKNTQFEGLVGSRDVSRTDSFSETDVEKILRLLENPEKFKEMSNAAQEWSQQYTLEKFETEIKKLLVSKET